MRYLWAELLDKAVFTQAVTPGVFAERYDLDKNNPAEMAAANDIKILLKS